MIYEGEESSVNVAHILSANDEYVRFAFECNETTSHDNGDKEEEKEVKSL